jgi:zinc metalloprotease ZmpB
MLILVNRFREVKKEAMYSSQNSTWTRLGLKAAAVLTLAMAASPWLHAQKPGPSRSFIVQFPQDQEFELRDNMRINARTGQPVALYQPGGAPSDLEPSAAALAYLRQSAGILQLDHADLRDLRVRAVQPNPAGTVVRVAQWLGSLPVFADDIAITLDRAGKVTFVMNGYARGVQLANVTPLIGAEAALQTALQHMGASGPLNYSNTRLGVLPTRDRNWLAYAVRVEPQDLLGDFEVMVDAETGAVLQAIEKTAYHHPDEEGHLEAAKASAPTQPGLPIPYAPAYLAHSDPFMPTPTWDEAPLPQPYLPAIVNGAGNVFDPDPLSTVGVSYGGSYVDGSDANNASLTATLAPVTLLEIDFTGGIHTLRGPYASIQDFEAPNKGLFTQASSNFTFDRNADNFEAVNTYYFIDLSLRYINTTLLSPCMPFQYAGGMRFDPSGLNGSDNSHYVGGSGRIAFGEGGVDDAEDSDVILHELGHGLHDWLTVGNLSQVNGLSEGCGDYWAASYSRSKNQWVVGQPEYPFVFNWDGHNPFWGGRTVNYLASYPGGLVNQIHTDGQIWSTCLMKIFDQIGKFKTDKVFIEGLRMTNGSSSQLDAALAVRQAAINLSYTATEITIITNMFQGCGYAIPNFLPVEYLGFEASRSTATNVELQWETARERVNTGFHIERSTDGTLFKTISFVPSAGGERGQTYSFTDLDAPRGSTHYRLRQVDLDGTESHSEVRTVAGIDDMALQVSVAPQPAHDRLWIRVGGMASASTVHLSITDLSGRELWVQDLPASALESAYALPLNSEWAAGLYLLEISSGAQRLSKRFVIDGDR